MPGKRKTHIATLAKPALSEIANKAIQRHGDGRFVAKVSPEQAEEALERLANGESMITVTNDLGVSRAALFLRARQDDDFAQALDAALECRAHIMHETIMSAVFDGEFSTGSVERDRLCLDAVKWSNKVHAPKRYGERIQVDQRTIAVHFHHDDPEV